jgi:ABC-type branched-subunit amino acid transport system substrate-binding protein
MLRMIRAKEILFALFALVALASCEPDLAGPAVRAIEASYAPPRAITPSAPGQLPDRLSASEFAEGPVKIAVLLPLSGASSATGKALLDAASLALFDAYDPRLQLLPFDTLGTPDGAARAATDAADAGVQVMLGPLFSDSIRRAGPIARQNHIPMVAFSNNRDVAGEGVYLLSFMPDQEVAQVIGYAVAEGYTRFAALIPEGPYGEMVLESLSRAIADEGGSLTALEIYPPVADGVFDPVRRLANYDVRRRAYLNERRALEALGGDMADDLLEQMENLETLGEPPFDAVLVPEGGELLRSLVPLLPFFEVDPAKIRFLGTGLWDDRSLMREPPLKGGWYASASPEQTDPFFARFEALYGYRPPRIVSLSYDAVSLVSHMARFEIRSERFSRRAFLDPNGYNGIDGIFRFTADGVSERALSIVEIRPQGFVTIAEGRHSFEH